MEGISLDQQVHYISGLPCFVARINESLRNKERKLGFVYWKVFLVCALPLILPSRKSKYLVVTLTFESVNCRWYCLVVYKLNDYFI